MCIRDRGCTRDCRLDELKQLKSEGSAEQIVLLGVKSALNPVSYTHLDVYKRQWVP